MLPEAAHFNFMSKLTDEELLQILETSEESIPTNSSNLSLFISTFGMQEGTSKIPVKLVYRLYKLWAKAPIGEASFYQEMSLLLPTKRANGGIHHYTLDSNTLKLDEEIYKLIREKRIPKEKSDNFKKHFDNFLKKYMIESGNVWVSYQSVYDLYHSWVKKNYKKHPLSQKNFRIFCQMYFTTKGEPLELALNRKGIGEETSEES